MKPFYSLKKTKKPSITWFVLFAALGLMSFNYLFLLAPGLDQNDPMQPYLNGVFPTATPNGGAGGAASYTITNAFPNLTFIDPVKILNFPNNQLMVIGKPGLVWIFDKNPNTTQKTLILDVSANTKVGADGGMLGAALHPEFGQAGSPNRGYFYLWYRYSPDPSTNGQQGYMRLSRFNIPDGQTLADPNSEYVLIQQFDRHDWHNGGDMFFGPDGFLYLVIGDEGGANDQFNRTQSISDWLFGGVLRIDLDQRGGAISHPIRRQPNNGVSPPSGWPNSFTQGYYIPNDNPWLDVNGGILEEFWAVGTRSPHRMTYDAVTGDIWIGDIGQGTQEEISIVAMGDNLQWPYKEGDIDGPKAKPNPLIGVDKIPVYAYPRSFGRCVIGGYVIRGNSATKYPELAGKYIFGDHEVQNVWTLEKGPDGRAENVTFLLNVPTEGAGGKDGISSFGIDDDGTVYILDLFGTNLDGGKIHKLVREGGSIPDPPSALSELDVFTDLDNLTPIPGIIPYTVNTPLWSDRAAKRRWIALPNDGTHDSPTEQIHFDSENNWQFPAGTVLIKHFDLPVNENSPNQLVKLETRFVIFTAEGAYALTYRWNEAGTEAYLINDEETRNLTVTRANGTQYTQTWSFPSRQQCMDCHNAVAGFALGVKTRQLNGDYTYPSTGITSNQLETWNHLGIFHEDIGDPLQHPQNAPLEAANVSPELKIRSYLDANCSYCHRPNGVEGAFDARGGTAFQDQNLINAAAISHASPPGAQIIIPGASANSLLWIRDNSVGTDKMPPVGKSLVDDTYINQLSQWINNLDNNSPASIAEGWYTLQVRSNGQLATVSNASTAENSPVRQGLAAGSTHQKWYVQAYGNNYRILAEHSNKVLATVDWRANRGAQVVQQSWTAAQNQLWYFEATTNGHYKIINAYNGLVLDARSAQGGNLATWTENTNQDQEWQLNATTGGTPPLLEECTEIYLSDLDWLGTPINGWGPVEKDLSNGGTGTGDGSPMTINGQTYSKGLGAHANSEITYALNGAYKTFRSDIGVDDSTCGIGTIAFEVKGDGISLYQSPVMGQADAAISIEVDITNVNELKLIISNGGDNINCDHGDWADARLERCTIPEPPMDCTEDYLSDLDWVGTPINGWGPVEKDMSNGGTGTGDGSPLTLNGQTYAKGLGAHANSEITYALNGAYKTFRSAIGVDDSTCDIGTVAFEVKGDGITLYQSPVMGQADNTISIEVDISGVNELKLIVTNGGDNINCDHGDWADARVERCTNPEPPTECAETAVSDLNWIGTPTNSWGPVEKDRSNGEQGATDGNTLTINGQTYDKGLGAHAYSEITYNLNGAYQTFRSDIGVDDETCANGSVAFQVNGDGVILYQSQVLTQADDAISIEVDISGINELKLIVTDGGNGISCDHADWANPILEACSSPEPEPEPVTIAEVGSIIGDHNWTTVNLNHSFTNPVVIAGAPSYNGSHQSVIRIQNVTANSFQVKIKEWECWDGWHTTETIPYMVVEAGVHTLPNGSLLMAGNIAAVNQSWTTQAFPQSFPTNPVVFAQCITENDAEAVNTRIDEGNTNANQIRVKLKEQDGAQGGHANEQVSWVAIQAGSDNGALKFEAANTARSYNHNFSSLSFGQSYGSNAIFIAEMGSEYGGDACAVRYRNLTATGAELLIEEEKCGDTELSHTTEIIHYMLFDQPGTIEVIPTNTNNLNTEVSRPAVAEIVDYEILLPEIEDEGCGEVGELAVVNLDHQGLPEGAELQVYPNPATEKEQLNIELFLPEMEKVRIQLFNLQGQLVQERGIQMDKIFLKTAIPLQGLSNGVYFLKVEGRNWRSTERIILQ